MQFVDECTIELKAGNGGNGIVAWRREAHNPYGGPYGGDGGDGGDIILVGDLNENTLLPLRNHKLISAAYGENGRTKLASGKKGENTYIKVPLGTVAYNLATGQKICEILTNHKEYVIQHGGHGGHGNGWFKNPQNKIPNLHENGDVIEPLKVKLVIKYMADVGLVGLPNAGKSTFVGAVTSAKPKTANYQFTTLNPVLGICKHQNDQLIVADIPGLIAGASQGKGLGHEFLRHIERCTILIHLISLDPGENPKIIDAYQTIVNELKIYSTELIKKPIIVVGNKIDKEGSIDNQKQLEQYLKHPITVISALNKTNLNPLLDLIFNEYHQIKQKQAKQTTPKVKVIEVLKKPDNTENLEIVQSGDHDWTITSPYLKYWTNRIPLDTNDNIIRYNDKLKKIKLEEQIKKLGGVVGDTLHIYGNELVLE